MNIEYSDMHEFAKEELERLFLSVGWSSGRYPEKLVVAMRNYETVILPGTVISLSVWSALWTTEH